jgi:RNA-directed DNA polymerase
VNSKPAEQLWLPFCEKGDCSTLALRAENPVNNDLLEQILSRENLFRALRQVERNCGSPGIDRMTVKELRPYLKINWPSIRDALISGKYRPLPVRRVRIPKPGGGIRNLGVPTVLDRFIQQAILQVLQSICDPKFSSWSYGFRPGRSAHQAIRQAQRYIRYGYTWVVDLDLEKFFDRVNHDVLMHKLSSHISDRKVLRLINYYLRSGVFVGGVLEATVEGTPQGGPLSPLLANVLLDIFDRELERRGLKFVRYSDDSNIYVRSRRSASRVLKSLSRFLLTKLKLKINETKSAVGRPWERKFLGFSFTTTLRRRLSDKALKSFKFRIRETTRRTRGRNLKVIIEELRKYLPGWSAYYGYIEYRSILKELDSWIRRKLRCYLWKQWGRRQYRELRNRGVSRNLSWNTVKSAHGPWRLSRSPALSIALPGLYFDGLGLPRMYVKPT